MSTDKITRFDFARKIKGHDWFYHYSDDHRSWSRGKETFNKIREEHQHLECPFDMSMLQKWAHKMILENFVEESPGEWYPNPRKYKCIAGTPRTGLITQSEYDEVTLWMSLGCTAEQIANFV